MAEDQEDDVEGSSTRKAERPCVVCGEPFLPARQRRTCSRSCRKKDYRQRNLRSCRERERRRTGAVPRIVYAGLPVLRTCEECGDFFQQRPHRGKRPNGKMYEQNRFCDRACFRSHVSADSEKVSRRAARWRRMKANGERDRITLPELHRRDEGVCYLCGLLVSADLPCLHPHAGSADHVVAVVNGGTDTWDNVRLAHRRCNSIKGTSGLTVVSLERVLDPNPFAEHLDDYTLAP